MLIKCKFHQQPAVSTSLTWTNVIWFSSDLLLNQDKTESAPSIWDFKAVYDIASASSETAYIAQDCKCTIVLFTIVNVKYEKNIVVKIK